MQDPIQKYKDHIVDTDTQQRLNQPLTDKTGFNEGHEDFLRILIEKIEKGDLNPYDVKTLYNKKVYEALSDEDKEQTDLTALNIMAIVRQIEKLWNLEKKATFQIQNLVETVFQMKSKFEEKHGDVYVI